MRQKHNSKKHTQEPPSIIFVDFRETDSTPNQFFLDFRDKPGMEHLPIVATVHESHIAKRIDDAPIRRALNTHRYYEHNK